MDREGFRSRLKQYKEARESNPQLKYWEWKDIPKYAEGEDGIEEWNPRITAEGYDDKGYYVRAMNSLPEITVVGSKRRQQSERPIQYSYVQGYPEASVMTTDYNVGAGALERVYPEFEILTGTKLLSNSLTAPLKFNNAPLSRTRKVNRNRIAAKRHLGTYNQSTDQISGNTVGELLTDEGTEQFVFNSLRNGDEVFKMPNAYGRRSIDDLFKKSQEYLKFNKVPNFSRVKLEGHVDNGRGTLFPIFSQKKLNTLGEDIYSVTGNQRWNTEIMPTLDKAMSQYGYKNVDGKYIKGNKIVGDIHPGNIGYDSNGNIKLIDVHIDGFAEGGQVEPNKYSEIPVTGFDATTGKFTYGYNPSAGYMSGTDPVAEAMMWGIGGGAASAALRKIFPTYGAMAGWLAFGDNGKENMLVIPNGPTKKRGPIADNLINKEVKDYYANDVIPRDVIHTNNQSFITDGNFMYDILPEEEFNPGVAGYYNKLNDKIAINNRYAGDKKALDDVMAHEVDHLYNNQYPLDKRHNNILNRAYTVQDDDISRAARAARKESEKRATNKNVRYGLYTELKERLGRTPSIKEVDEYIDSIPDQELLDRLYRANSYGAAYVMSIEDRAELQKAPINQYKKTRATQIRKALKLIAMNESNQEQNYA